ncbi:MULTISPECIES: pyridoxal phosphate-dependent aminotransferase [unclassified Modicisalibacter]|uniref:pyridoxal phosphate-dependent aminotransferase n=1 Tax=unclassified Modicisalibacter TaxID=2679913 RepID=UPI001CCFA08F|nr:MULTISPECIES: pyridoxal phosphate-dependent aminotransferase [unclassified Modicisalibacter]MBZ9557283.1 pyridoxal phosphate-dependent aminotransferase [Modicisalibacter sp. R2A 31.J]MBZ9574003.1 pyridoxal phosphate-dependent aminotransferase [Modicisalibacter sp. MOD 31.J]
MHYSRLTERIAGDGAAAWNIHYRALERQSRGDDVIVLSVGDPDFTTPEPIIESAVNSLRGGATHYADVQGKPRLRELIADTHRRQGGAASTSPANVAVMAGAQCGLYAVAQCVLEPGDEVLVPEPMYVTYEAALQAAGARLVRVPLRAANAFQPDPAEFAAAITPHTRAMLLNSPHNPTGQVLGAAHWQALAALCREHDLWLLCDAVYAELTFDAVHHSPDALPGMTERTAVIGSLSKSHAMTGWRLGWVIGPETLIGHLSNLALCMLYGSPDFIQDAACEALANPPAELATMRDTYRARRDAVLAALADSETLDVLCPAAGMFMMIDIRRTGLSAQAFADRLLDEQGVSVLSGEAFGPSAAGFVRLSLTVDAERLREACRRVARCAAACLVTSD